MERLEIIKRTASKAEILSDTLIRELRKSCELDSANYEKLGFVSQLDYYLTEIYYQCSELIKEKEAKEVVFSDDDSN